MQKFICCVFTTLTVLVSHAQSEINHPKMSREEADRILKSGIDDYNTNAIKALMWYGRQDYEKACVRRDEQVAQLDLVLLGLDRCPFGKPPRSGPWPEAEFQALLVKQHELRKKSQPSSPGYK